MAQLSNGSGSTSPWHCDLLRAIKQGDEGKVKGLVLGDDGERAKQTYKTTLRQGLQAAAGLGKTLIVQWLLDNGAEVEAVENEVSALFRAVEWGHCPIVQKLIDKGADIEVKDRGQRTVLFHAVSKAHVQVVKALFQAGADVSVRDIELRTVLLHVAAQKQDSKIDKQYGCFPPESQEPNHLEGQTIVKLLLEKDIDLEAKDKLGRTVLHWAAATGKEKLLASLICGTACKRANIDARNRRSKTALHLAAENHHPEIARILLEQGADCNARSDGAWAPLHIAAEKGYLDIIKLLSHHGANLNAETTNGMTPLHWAATNGNVEVVKELLSQPGIKRHPKDSPGYTPLMRAAQHKHTVIAHLLSSSDDGRDLSTIARQACTEYKATIVDFFPQRTDRKKFAVFNKPTIFELLYGIEPKGDGERKPLWKAAIESTKVKPAFRWIHLPANNVRCSFPLLTKLADSANSRWLGPR
jgi:ankyrin repeat protein